MGKASQMGAAAARQHSRLQYSSLLVGLVHRNELHGQCDVFLATEVEATEQAAEGGPRKKGKDHSNHVEEAIGNATSERKFPQLLAGGLDFRRFCPSGTALLYHP